MANSPKVPPTENLGREAVAPAFPKDQPNRGDVKPDVPSKRQLPLFDKRPGVHGPQADYSEGARNL